MLYQEGKAIDVSYRTRVVTKAFRAADFTVDTRQTSQQCQTSNAAEDWITGSPG
jgi:hypothetical protein